MGMSLDFINSVYDDLRGPLRDDYYRSTHLYDKISGRRVKAVGGGNIVRPIATGAPARAVAIRTGDETLDMTRREIVTDKLTVDLYRMALAINIPQREIDRMTSKKSVVNLMQQYPLVTMALLKQDIESFLLTGVSTNKVITTAELLGMVTLNGQYDGGASAPTGTQHGVLDFLTPANQTQAVLGITKSNAKQLVNQYADISTWAADGWDTWKAQYRRCKQFNPRNKGPDLIICDDATFGNFQREKRDLVRIVKVKDDVDKGGGDAVVDVFQDAEVQTSLFLDLAQFTGVAADGVTYMLTTSDWEMHELVRFALTRFARLSADQEVVTSHGAQEGQTVCNRFNTQAAISGGST